MPALQPTLRFALGSACLLLVLSFGFRAGFGLFVAPMAESREWDIETISFAFALQNLVWGVVAVFAGGLADRLGNLPVLIGGVILYALGMVGMSWVNSELGLLMTAGILVGAGIAATSFGIVLPALARAVPPERRGWALGLGTAAGSFGQFLIVPMMQLFVDLFGWVGALQGLGLLALMMVVFAIPIAPFSGANEASSLEIQQPLSRVLKKAFGVPSYTLLVLGFFVCGFHVAFITVHMPGFLVDAGFDPKVGAWSLSLIGLCNIVGAYLSGNLTGRRPMRKILAFIYVARAIAITLFLILPLTLGSVLVFSAVMGFLWLATVPPTSGLVATFFGTRYMSFLYGVVFLSHQIGSFTGVWLGGWLYEMSGSYDGIWYAGVLLGLVAAVLHWPIREESFEGCIRST